MSLPCPIRTLMALLFFLPCAAFAARAQETPSQPATARQAGPNERTKLPQRHPYQRTLRDYLATLTEADFTHGVTDPFTVPEKPLTAEEQYRMYIMTTMHQPLVGWKRGVPAINVGPKQFLLSAIEGPLPPPEDEEPPVALTVEQRDANPDYTPVPIREPHGIVVPPVWPETLIAVVDWDYAGNPYHNNAALRRRAFVTAVVKLIMLDDFMEQNPKFHRADWSAYQLVTCSVGYTGAKDLLPKNVQQAYEAGLLKLGREMLSWGVKGEEPNKDMSAPIGLWYVAQACGDEKFSAQVEAYAKQLMTDPHYFHPGGYWVERGTGLDVGFAGGANFYAVWAALMTDWPFAKQTVEEAYRLRAHLTLPDPDGFHTGPSHFNARLGSPAVSDQWHWDGARDLAALMVSDEAACLAKFPTEELVTGAAANRTSWFNFQIKQNPVRPDVQGRKSAGRTGYWANEDLRGSTWTWRLWQTFNFPIGVNVGHQFYRPGAYAHVRKLQADDSPALKLPVERGEVYLRNFGNAFFVTRQSDYGAILHTGRVAEIDPNDNLLQYPGPAGFGGGQLSAYWTPETGSVLLGRRIATRYDINYDTLDLWRQWPLNAVTGATPQGEVYSSARNAEPSLGVNQNSEDEPWADITSGGLLMPVMPDQKNTLRGQISYQRTFRVDSDDLRVETIVTGDGQDRFAELYETLPVYLHDARRQPMAQPTSIEFRIGDAWQPATADYQEEVVAVRLNRFAGAVEIRFDHPRRVKLSPEDWKDTYLTRAVCRNVLIDLLENKDQPAAVKKATVSYRIAPAKKPAAK